MGFLTRYLPRAAHVLRTEGPSVLLRKIQRRLQTTPLTVTRKPDILRLSEPFKPVAFPVVGSPLASVVIPAYNQFPFTHHCLAALARAGADVPFEVIVVDDHDDDGTRERLATYPGVRVVRNERNLGFVGSCNRGASIAKGRYLVFLNSDTQVQPGWLDALVATFAGVEDAGIVGSRLIYPDGRQQEAGAILFRDGSAWNYGHLDDPYKPEYSYRREADYCSGAALAIGKPLFDRLGGFDPEFAPAYYEDTDLAFRVRAAGLRVFYQPLSVVVHFEGISAGRDEGDETGLKRFQRINAEKLRVRWGAELQGFGERGGDLEVAKERGVQRRALVVDNYMITPDRESGSLRMLNLFRILQGLGYKVTFGAANLEAPQPYVSDLQRIGVEVLYRPYVRSLGSYLKAQGQRIDLVILSRADAAAATMDAARAGCPNARIVFDTVDLHFLREARLADLRGDHATRRIAERRKAQELDLMRRADLTFVVSDVERKLLATEAPDVEVHVVSNIHRIFGSAKPWEARRDLLFIGSFAHPPNTDAVLYLAREVMPMVEERTPGLVLNIIGADPPADVRACARESIRVLGYVPDVTPWFASCRLSVAPLRYGAGVKGKVNQSLAHGLPVVATTVAIEGMGLVDGESVLVADDAESFATAIERLYGDAALWQRLSEGGLAVMERRFSFAAAERAVRGALGLGKAT